MTCEHATIARPPRGADRISPRRRTLTDTLDDIDRALHDLASQYDYLRMLLDRAHGLADALREGRGS